MGLAPPFHPPTSVEPSLIDSSILSVALECGLRVLYVALQAATVNSKRSKPPSLSSGMWY